MWDWLEKKPTKQKTQKTWRHTAALLLWRQSRLLWPSAISPTCGKGFRLIFSQWNKPFLYICNSRHFSCVCLGCTSLKLSVEGSEALWEMQNELIERNKRPFSSVYHPVWHQLSGTEKSFPSNLNLIIHNSAGRLFVISFSPCLIPTVTHKCLIALFIVQSRQVKDWEKFFFPELHNQL